MNKYTRQIFAITANSILLPKITCITKIDLSFFTPGVLNLTLTLISIILILLVFVLISSLKMRKAKKKFEINNIIDEKSCDEKRTKEYISDKTERTSKNTNICTNKNTSKNTNKSRNNHYKKRKDIIYDRSVKRMND